MQCDCDHRIRILEEKIDVLEKVIGTLTEEFTQISTNTKKTKNIPHAHVEEPEKLAIVGSYKEPNLTFADSEFMLKIFNEQRENLPYALFGYIYFKSPHPENKTILAPNRTITYPRLLEVADHSQFLKIRTQDVITEINRIICTLINDKLTKGDIYIKMDLADKKLIADIACRRFDKKLNSDVIKNYTDAIAI